MSDNEEITEALESKLFPTNTSLHLFNFYRQLKINKNRTTAFSPVSVFAQSYSLLKFVYPSAPIQKFLKSGLKLSKIKSEDSNKDAAVLNVLKHLNENPDVSVNDDWHITSKRFLNAVQKRAVNKFEKENPVRIHLSEDESEASADMKLVHSVMLNIECLDIFKEMGEINNDAFLDPSTKLPIYDFQPGEILLQSEKMEFLHYLDCNVEYLECSIPNSNLSFSVIYPANMKRFSLDVVQWKTLQDRSKVKFGQIILPKIMIEERANDMNRVLLDYLCQDNKACEIAEFDLEQKTNNLFQFTDKDSNEDEVIETRVAKIEFTQDISIIVSGKEEEHNEHPCVDDERKLEFVMICDRPFYFLVHDTEFNILLLCGQYFPKETKKPSKFLNKRRFQLI